MRGEKAARGRVPALGEISSAAPFPKEGFYAPITNQEPDSSPANGSHAHFKAEKSSCPKTAFLLQMAALGVAQILFSPSFEAAHKTLPSQSATAPPRTSLGWDSLSRSQLL